MNIITVGEILWDVFDDRQLIGGAPFNFSAHARKLGHDVTFVSAVGDDDLGRMALARVEQLGLSTRHLPVTCKAAMGTVRVFIDAGGQPSYTIHRPAAYDFPALSDDDVRAIAASQPEWICFGTLAQMAPDVRAVTKRIIGACPSAARLYDINLRKDSHTPELICELLAEASVLKINDEEVVAVARMFDGREMAVAEFCRTYAARYGLSGVCVTRGVRGCYLWLDGQTADVPGRTVKVADAVGAGDAFAAAFVHGLSQRWLIQRIGEFGNRLGALVASRSGAIPEWSMNELEV